MGNLVYNNTAHPAITTHAVGGADTPLVLSLPHSGEIYPDDFNPHPDLTHTQYHQPADRYVDELMGAFQDLKIPTVKAEFPRSYMDVNRRQYDLPVEIMADPDGWNGKAVRMSDSSMIWWQIYGKPTYERKLTNAEIRNRIGTCYVPYHQALTTLLENARTTHGVSYLLDCHSMLKCDPNTTKERPQIDIGTRSGLSCDNAVMQFLKQGFEERGYYVGVNEKFAGGEITQRYGYPECGQHALQIEFRRDLYMNDHTLERNDHFSTLQQDCTAVLTAFNTFLKTLELS